MIAKADQGRNEWLTNIDVKYAGPLTENELAWLENYAERSVFVQAEVSLPAEGLLRIVRELRVLHGLRAVPESIEEQEARHRRVNVKLRAEAIEDRPWDAEVDAEITAPAKPQRITLGEALCSLGDRLITGPCGNMAPASDFVRYTDGLGVEVELYADRICWDRLTYYEWDAEADPESAAPA